MPISALSKLHAGLKSSLRCFLPRSIRTSHIDEAVAAGLGYASYAAMLGSPGDIQDNILHGFGRRAALRMNVLRTPDYFLNFLHLAEACCEAALHHLVAHPHTVRPSPQLGEHPLRTGERSLPSACLLETLLTSPSSVLKEFGAVLCTGNSEREECTISRADADYLIQALARLGIVLQEVRHAYGLPFWKSGFLCLGDYLCLQEYSTAVVELTWRSRAFPQFSLASLFQSGALSKPAHDFVSGCVVQHKKVVVTGATGSGKTTLVNAMTGMVPWSEPVCVFGDPLELYVPPARPALVWEGDMRQSHQTPNMPTSKSGHWLSIGEVGEAWGIWAIHNAVVAKGALLGVYPVAHRNREGGHISEQVLRRVANWHLFNINGSRPPIDTIISMERKGTDPSCWTVREDWTLERVL